MNGRKGELIHTFNKHEVSHKNKEYFNSIKVCRPLQLQHVSLGNSFIVNRPGVCLNFRSRGGVNKK